MCVCSEVKGERACCATLWVQPSHRRAGGGEAAASWSAAILMLPPVAHRSLTPPQYFPPPPPLPQFPTVGFEKAEMRYKN